MPGSNDLETALRRYTIRKANEINERHFQEEQEAKKRNNMEKYVVLDVVLIHILSRSSRLSLLAAFSL